MKIMTCPLNGPRNIDEFAYFGPLRARPDPEGASDADWTRYIFHAPNPVGVIREWWCHTPTNFFFIAERDTASDEILRTYAPDEAPAGRPDGGPAGGDSA